MSTPTYFSTSMIRVLLQNMVIEYQRVHLAIKNCWSCLHKVETNLSALLKQICNKIQTKQNLKHREKLDNTYRHHCKCMTQELTSKASSTPSSVKLSGFSLAFSTASALKRRMKYDSSVEMASSSPLSFQKIYQGKHH